MDFAGEQGVRAAREAAQVNAELLGRNVETAQQAMKMGAEATVRTFERLAQTMTEVFSLEGSGNGAGAEQLTKNISVASEAGTSLAIAAQEASKEWLNLARQGIKTNLEAMSDLMNCRSLQEMTSIQSRLVRENLEQAVRAGQSIANASRRNLEEATRSFDQERPQSGH